MGSTIKEKIYEEFIKHIAEYPLLPTPEEFWELVEKAKDVLLENE